MTRPVNLTEKIRDASSLVPGQVWTPATDADGGVREHGDVAELTDLVDLTSWPDGMRLIVRRERPTPARSSRCLRRPTGGATRSS